MKKIFETKTLKFSFSTGDVVHIIQNCIYLKITTPAECLFPMSST